MTISELSNVDFSDVSDKALLQEYLTKANEAREDLLKNLPEHLAGLGEKEKFALFTQYADDEHQDQLYYNMSFLDEFMSGLSFSDAYRKVDPKNFSLSDEGFWADSSGDYISGSREDFLSEWFYPSDIAEWLERHDYDRNRECNESLGEWKDELDEADSIIMDLEERLDELG